MLRFIKITGITLFFVLVLFSFNFAQEESFTITTYYPSPYGVYKELKLYPNTSPSTCDANNEGAMYYDDDTNQSMVCRQTDTSTYAWESIGGGGVPSGAVMFFNLTSCPSGWTDKSASWGGLYLVAKKPGAGGTLGAIVGTALSNQENRPVGQHSHGITDPGHTHTERPTAFGSGHPMYGTFMDWTSEQSSTTGSSVTGITIDDAGSVAGTNAPYIQFLVCQKD